MRVSIFRPAALVPIVAAVLTTTSASAQNLSCPLSRAKTVVKGDTIHNTGGLEYQDILGVKLGFVQGGTTLGCVIVQFSAEVGTAAGHYLAVHAAMDNDAVHSNPLEFIFSSRGGAGLDFASNSATFVFNGVAPGPHTVTMQWVTNGEPVSMSSRTMVVYFQH